MAERGGSWRRGGGGAVGGAWEVDVVAARLTGRLNVLILGRSVGVVSPVVVVCACTADVL